MSLSPTLPVCEVPLLKLGLLDLEVFCHRLGGAIALLCDGKGELLVQRFSNCLGTVKRLVDFQTNVEVLSSQEIGPAIMLGLGQQWTLNR